LLEGRMLGEQGSAGAESAAICTHRTSDEKHAASTRLIQRIQSPLDLVGTPKGSVLG
jgi:hypothetical protein